MSYLSKNSNGSESKMKSFIYIKTQKEGFHYWKNAPKEVEFLKYPHRHIFYIKVSIELLEHNDREIEFFMFKKEVDDILISIWAAHGLKHSAVCDGVSCEMMSDELGKYLQEVYPKRKIIIDISEDDENGSYKEY